MMDCFNDKGREVVESVVDLAGKEDGGDEPLAEKDVETMAGEERGEEPFDRSDSA